MNGQFEPVDMRWADCGQVQQGGWSVAWAQLIGVHHPSLSEDSVAHRMITLTPGAWALSLAVADGVGGGARGDVASSALVDHCTKAPRALLGDAEGLIEWMRMAEGEVQLKLREVSFSPGAATMAAAWLMPDGRGHIMRVGDARAYHCSSAGHDATPSPPVCTLLTRDQTYAFVHEAPPAGGSLDDPARMIGIGTGFMGEPEIEPLYLNVGQTLLLCSDGLCRGLDTAQMGRILGTTNDLVEAGRQLAIAAREQGSSDDISVLMAQREPGIAKIASKHPFSRLRQWWKFSRSQP